MADRLRTTAIAIVDKLGQLSALALIFFHTLHNQLSQRPARSSPVPASTPPSSVGESCGPVAGRFNFIKAHRNAARGHVLGVHIFDAEAQALVWCGFDLLTFDLINVPPDVPSAVRDEALGGVLAVLAKERGHAA